MNGEDILLQFAVPSSEHPPLLVTQSMKANASIHKAAHHFTDGQGLSTKSGHFEARVVALQFFVELMGFPFKDTRSVAHGKQLWEAGKPIVEDPFSRAKI